MAINASLVFYTSGNTTTIPIVNGQTLDVILKNIDAAINTHNTAPDYSGYNLYCVKQVDGTTHPTNTQNFAEGISKNLCDFHTTYTTFVGGQYVSDLGVLTTAVTGLQSPGLIYVPFSITNTDTTTQVWNKVFAGLNVLGTNTTTSTFDPFTANWSTLSISPSHSTITTWNNVIAYLSALATTVSGKQLAIANIDNSGNCLSSIGGTNNDTIRATVLLLTTLACSLPVYTAGSITWGGVSTGTTLQNSIQNIVNTSSSLLTNTVQGAGTGLAISAIGSTYQGKKLAIDNTYTQLYKAMITSSDTTPNFINSKFAAGTGISLAVLNSGGNEQLQITNSSPVTNKVAVNSSDSSADYLVNKIPSTGDPQWGLSLTSSASGDNSNLQLIPSIGNPFLLSQQLMNYWASNPTLLSQFKGLIDLANANPGAPITDLSVVLTTNTFVLAWTHLSGTAQNSKWRIAGTTSWFLTGFITPNPLSSTDSANTLDPIPDMNTVFDMQVDTIYSGGTVGSNIFQMIDYAAQTLGNTVVAGVISVNQSPMPVDAIQYRLRNSVPTVIQNIATTGASPNVSFTSVASGNYTVQWRVGTLVNGGMLWSDDATQHNAYYVSGTITVP